MASLRHRLFIEANGYSLLHHAARLFLPEVSSLTAEVREHSLPGSPGTSGLVVKTNLGPNISQCTFEGTFQ